MMDLVSVIVPVYNVEKYLRRCLDSIIGQSYKNLEVILVDDGSTDDSGKICDEYAKKDKRVKVIHKKNGGPSSARNTGIKKSNGVLLSFVDGDDYIDVTMIEMGAAIFKQDYTVGYVQFNLEFFNTYNKYIPYNKVTTQKCNDKENVIKSIISLNYLNKKMHGTYGPVRCIGGKIYKKDIIKNNNLEFDESLYIYEDGIFNLQYLKYVDSIYIDNRSLYKYRQIQTSTSYRYNSDQIKQYRIINDYLFCNYFKYEKCLYMNCLELCSAAAYREYKYKKIKLLDFLKYFKSFMRQSPYDKIATVVQYRDLLLIDRLKLFCIKSHCYRLFYVLLVIKHNLERRK